MLHCDISGRGSCVTHGRCVWRELGGDVDSDFVLFFAIGRASESFLFSLDYSRHNVTRGRRLRLTLALSRYENLTRTNFMICRYAKPRPVQDELSAWLRSIGVVRAGLVKKSNPKIENELLTGCTGDDGNLSLTTVSKPNL